MPRASHGGASSSTRATCNRAPYSSDGALDVRTNSNNAATVYATSKHIDGHPRISTEINVTKSLVVRSRRPKAHLLAHFLTTMRLSGRGWGPAPAAPLPPSSLSDSHWNILASLDERRAAAAAVRERTRDARRVYIWPTNATAITAHCDEWRQRVRLADQVLLMTPIPEQNQKTGQRCFYPDEVSATRP